MKKILQISAVVFVCIIFILGFILLNQNNHKEKTLQTSSNPLFADGVPAHLQCPPELIGKYVKEITREDVLKIQAIAKEVVTKYNPKRIVLKTLPLAEKMEMEFHANSDIDWVIQTMLDFPEKLKIDPYDPKVKPNFPRSTR